MCNPLEMEGKRVMKISDAAQILEISGTVTPEIVQAAYRAAAKKYHPDLNPAGAEMMKIVNAANDVLKDYTGEIEHDTGTGATSDGGQLPASCQ